jgi:ABC-type nitrate/sulfonate/bicarbonate transport system ATPase subunit
MPAAVVRNGRPAGAERPPGPGAAVAANVAIRRKEFRFGGVPVPVLGSLEFTVAEHEFLGILGPSGCGKTTLLRILAGLDLDYEGSIVVGGRPVRGPGRDRSLLFQESRLLPWMSVERNVTFALPDEMERSEKKTRMADALRLVGLSDYARAMPSQLSGGMVKRVALARAIINSPNILLLDEPFSALDSPTKYSLQDELKRLRAAEGRMATILVTHDIDEAVYLSDRILILGPRVSCVLTEIPVSLERPRDRTRSEFHEACARVTRTIFDLWWRTSRGGAAVNDHAVKKT